MGTHIVDGRVYSDATIEPGILYALIDYDTADRTGQYAVTPDGVGMYWYDSEEEAIATATGILPEDPEVVELTEQELDNLRNQLSHTGHHSRTGGTYWCDTCDSPYCDLI